MTAGRVAPPLDSVLVEGRSWDPRVKTVRSFSLSRRPRAQFLLDLQDWVARMLELSRKQVRPPPRELGVRGALPSPNRSQQQQRTKARRGAL